jgi:hypothetical protein
MLGLRFLSFMTPPLLSCPHSLLVSSLWKVFLSLHLLLVLIHISSPILLTRRYLHVLYHLISITVCSTSSSLKTWLTMPLQFPSAHQPVTGGKILDHHSAPPSPKLAVSGISVPRDLPFILTELEAMMDEALKQRIVVGGDSGRGDVDADGLYYGNLAMR